jgi:antitoxin MazE
MIDAVSLMRGFLAKRVCHEHLADRRRWIYKEDTVDASVRREEPVMITRVVRWGNSLALRIPSTFARTLDVQEGAAVRLTLDHGKLLVVPVVDASVYDVAELAAAINDDNNYTDVDFGRPMGSEIW